MKKIRTLLISAFLSLVLLSKATGFQPDTMYLYTTPHINDSVSLHLVVKGYLPRNCFKECTNVVMGNDTIVVTVGYYQGMSTVICNVNDTVFVNNFAPAKLNVKAIIGAGTIVRCDSFYNVKSYLLTTDLVSSVEEISSSTFALYPNPTTHQLTIQTSNLSTGNYQVTTTTGQLLLQNTITQPNFTIDVSTLPPGLYFLQLTNGKQRTVKRFVKQ